MGLPIYIYGHEGEKSNSNAAQQGKMGNRQIVGHFLRSRMSNVMLVDNQLKSDLYVLLGMASEDDNAGTNTNIHHSWSLNSSDQPENLKLGDFFGEDSQKLIQLKSKNGAFWIYYLVGGNKVLIYDFKNNMQFEISGADEMRSLACIDCKYTRNSELFVSIGMKSGELYIVHFNQTTLQKVDSKKTLICRDTRICDLWLGFLEHNLIVSFNTFYGVVITNLLTNASHCIPMTVDAQEIKASIEFPRMVLFTDTKIWYINNILKYSNGEDNLANNEVKIMLKSEEKLQKINPLMINQTLPSLLVETNERILSVSNCDINTNVDTINDRASNINLNWYKDTHTIIYKSLWNNIDYQVTSFKQYVFICDHHMYDTCLTIYEHSKISNEWLFLGYTDIRSKFNIKKVKNLSVINNGNSCLVSVLSDENENHHFNVTSRTPITQQQV